LWSGLSIGLILIGIALTFWWQRIASRLSASVDVLKSKYSSRDPAR
jgi:hypothetical protein